MWPVPQVPQWNQILWGMVPRRVSPVIVDISAITRSVDLAHSAHLLSVRGRRSFRSDMSGPAGLKRMPPGRRVFSKKRQIRVAIVGFGAAATLAVLGLGVWGSLIFGAATR